MKIDVFKTIEKTKDTINPYYDLRLKEINELEEKSKNIFDLIFNAFVFGYAQGTKAQKREEVR